MVWKALPRTWIANHGPFAFRLNALSQSFSVTLSGVIPGSQPALAMTASSRPYLSTTSCTSFSVSATLPASDLYADAAPPSFLTRASAALASDE